jgi:hypothetical protein
MQTVGFSEDFVRASEKIEQRKIKEKENKKREWNAYHQLFFKQMSVGSENISERAKQKWNIEREKYHSGLDPTMRELEIRRVNIALKRFERDTENESQLEFLRLYYKAASPYSKNLLTQIFQKKDNFERTKFLQDFQTISGRYASKTARSRNGDPSFRNSAQNMFINIFMYTDLFNTSPIMRKDLNVIDVLNIFLDNIKNILKRDMQNFLAALDAYKLRNNIKDPVLVNKKQNVQQNRKILNTKLMGLPLMNNTDEKEEEKKDITSDVNITPLDTFYHREWIPNRFLTLIGVITPENLELIKPDTTGFGNKLRNQYPNIDIGLPSKEFIFHLTNGSTQKGNVTTLTSLDVDVYIIDIINSTNIEYIQIKPTDKWTKKYDQFLDKTDGSDWGIPTKKLLQIYNTVTNSGKKFFTYDDLSFEVDLTLEYRVQDERIHALGQKYIEREFRQIQHYNMSELNDAFLKYEKKDTHKIQQSDGTTFLEYAKKDTHLNKIQQSMINVFLQYGVEDMKYIQKLIDAFIKYYTFHNIILRDAIRRFFSIMMFADTSNLYGKHAHSFREKLLNKYFKPDFIVNELLFSSYAIERYLFPEIKNTVNSDLILKDIAKNDGYYAKLIVRYEENFFDGRINKQFGVSFNENINPLIKAFKTTGKMSQTSLYDVVNNDGRIVDIRYVLNNKSEYEIIDLFGHLNVKFKKIEKDKRIKFNKKESIEKDIKKIYNILKLPVPIFEEESKDNIKISKKILPKKDKQILKEELKLVNIKETSTQLESRMKKERKKDLAFEMIYPEGLPTKETRLKSDNIKKEAKKVAYKLKCQGKDKEAEEAIILGKKQSLDVLYPMGIPADLEERRKTAKTILYGNKVTELSKASNILFIKLRKKAKKEIVIKTAQVIQKRKEYYTRNIEDKNKDMIEFSNLIKDYDEKEEEENVFNENAEELKGEFVYITDDNKLQNLIEERARLVRNVQKKDDAEVEQQIEQLDLRRSELEFKNDESFFS